MEFYTELYGNNLGDSSPFEDKEPTLILSVCIHMCISDTVKPINSESKAYFLICNVKCSYSWFTGFLGLNDTNSLRDWLKNVPCC